jgi:hypothetical protein
VLEQLEEHVFPRQARAVDDDFFVLPDVFVQKK